MGALGAIIVAVAGRSLLFFILGAGSGYMFAVMVVYGLFALHETVTNWLD